jgi:hypothetical protein
MKKNQKIVKHRFSSSYMMFRTLERAAFVHHFISRINSLPPGVLGGMSPGATWEPFTITEAEYFELVSVMRTWLLKPWVMQRDTNGASLNSIVPSII